MRVIEVPIINDDGSVQAVCVYTPDEVQRLLQFAANFMMAAGNAAIIMSGPNTDRPEELDD